MSAKPAVLTVATPPAEPLLIYDGDCNFCKFWILRWQQFTQGKVDYVASQEARVAQQFPELPQEHIEASVQFIETDGRVYGGAEAVFRSLIYGRCGGLSLWLYERIPGFAPAAEWVYQFVARRRTAFSFLTKLRFGDLKGALLGLPADGLGFSTAAGNHLFVRVCVAGNANHRVDWQRRDFAGGATDGIGAQGS